MKRLPADMDVSIMSKPFRMERLLDAAADAARRLERKERVTRSGSRR